MKGLEKTDLVCLVRVVVSGLGETRRPAMTEENVWKELDRPQAIECERVGECGDFASWVTAQGNLYVCDHHRIVFERQRRMDLEIVQNADLEGMAA
jgi:hypothetical protein